MSKRIELDDELFGFHPGNQGSALVVLHKADVVEFAEKYAVDFEDDPDGWTGGWTWGLGATRLNKPQTEKLRDFLTDVLKEMQ